MIFSSLFFFSKNIDASLTLILVSWPFSVPWLTLRIFLLNEIHGHVVKPDGKRWIRAIANTNLPDWNGLRFYRDDIFSFMLPLHFSLICWKLRYFALMILFIICSLCAFRLLFMLSLMRIWFASSSTCFIYPDSYSLIASNSRLLSFLSLSFSFAWRCLTVLDFSARLFPELFFGLIRGR